MLVIKVALLRAFVFFVLPLDGSVRCLKYLNGTVLACI